MESSSNRGNAKVAQRFRMRPTDRQMEIYEWMLEYQSTNGAPPSLRELCEHFGWRSTNGAGDHMNSMTIKGMLKHHAGRARCYEALASYREQYDALYG